MKEKNIILYRTITEMWRRKWYKSMYTKIRDIIGAIIKWTIDEKLIN